MCQPPLTHNSPKRHTEPHPKHQTTPPPAMCQPPLAHSAPNHQRLRKRASRRSHIAKRPILPNTNNPGKQPLARHTTNNRRPRHPLCASRRSHIAHPQSLPQHNNRAKQPTHRTASTTHIPSTRQCASHHWHITPQTTISPAMCKPLLTHCTSHQHRAQQRIQPHLLFLNPLFHRLRITHLMLLLPFHFTSQLFKGPRFMHNNPLIPLPRHSRCNALCESKTRRIIGQIFPRCIDIYPAVVLKQSASSHITLPILRMLPPVILHAHLQPWIRKIEEKAPFRRTSRRASGRTSTTPNIHPIRHIHPEIHIWHRQAMCHQQ